jgi:hypothetical protein
VDYNGSFKSLIVCDGLDVCGGNVFQSLKTVLGMNEYTPGSDWERPHTVKNMAHRPELPAGKYRDLQVFAQGPAQ